ncbi:hypothetical protein Tco_1353177 [Tanacetum coccineum]
MANVTSLLTSLCNNFKNSASTSNSGPLTPLVPTPIVSIPLKESEQNPETSTEKVQNPNLESTAQVPPSEEEESIFIEIPKPKAKKTVNVEIQDLNSLRPNSYQSKLPYPEKRLDEMLLSNAQIVNKWLSSLLRNKEKLEEIAIITVNAKCSAIIMKKVPEKLEDPGKFLIPCALQELDRTSALADSEASINLLPHSIYKQIGLKALTHYRCDTRSCNRSITHQWGPSEDVTREETLNLRVGKEELVYYADKSEKNKNKHFVHAISVIDFSKDDLFSGSTTTHSDDPSPSSSSVKTSDNLEEFADELTLLKKDIQEGNFQDHLNPLFEFDDNFKSRTINPLFDKMEENVKIKNSNVSDEPVLLNTPLSRICDDTSHNLTSEVISNHEPEQNESSITFSLRSDPLHHELAVRSHYTSSKDMSVKFGEYLSL